MRVLTLNEAFRRALSANPGVNISRTEVEVAETRRLLTRSFILPRVAVNGDFTRNSKEASFGNGPDAAVLLPANDWSYSLSVRQPLFAGLRDLRAYEQSKLAISTAREGVLDAENATLLAVGSDYLALSEAEALIAVEQRNIELARRRLRQSTDFYEVGEVTRVDVLRGEAGIKAAERQRVTAEAARDAAASRLRRALALDTEIRAESAGDFLPPLPAVAELVALAEEASPVLRQVRLRVEIAELEVKKQRGAYLPTLFLDGVWLHQKAGFPADQYGFVALNFSAPIFTGGETRARVREAEHQLEQARLSAEDLGRAIREEVRRALLDVTTARTLLALSREELNAAEQEYEETFALYRAQEADSLDLATAETALAESQRRVVSSGVAVQNAELRVWYLTGRLKQVALPAVAGEENQS
ncbi:MAG: TolC family protein [Thermoanaerobaculia bacterium]